MDIEQRIQNFEKMAADDPQNELGHFSLGKACLEAQRLEQAAASLQKVIELNAGFSKAYEHLAEAQAGLGQREQAIATLQKGFEVAAQRGDLMPKQAMENMLQELGAPVPQVQADAPAETPASGDQVRCCRCGQLSPKMPNAPFKGPLGARVFEHVCGDCWRAWVGMGTKVINELRLDFSHPQAGEIYDAHMKEFLQLPD